ncbi:hypothetical protein [Ascidiimonas aurantiaca]|uniref:hypothetical protein n=1 Tax=Ascidiimonas aurantiaca TaxID=1685432 RepID=UPI0030EEE053
MLQKMLDLKGAKKLTREEVKNITGGTRPCTMEECRGDTWTEPDCDCSWWWA